MSRSKRIPLLLLSLQIFLLALPTTSALKGYGESCRKRKECENGLTCLKNACQCERPESTIYSDSFKACLIRIGRRCGDDILGKNDTDFDTQKTEKSDSTTQASILTTACIENAECRKLRARHWCQCKDGFAPNADGSYCKPVSKYGEFCDEDDDQCDKSTGTVCIEGNCQCPFQDQYFDQHEGVCKSFAGGNCSIPKMSPCVLNAECSTAQVRMNYMTEKGVKKIHTKTVTQCLCKSGFSQTSNGYCFGSHETSCNSKQPCNSEYFLSCVDGKCKCRNPLHEAIDENTGQCMALVGTTCHPSKGPKCVSNSACIQGHCQCIAGHTPTPLRTCKLGYKEPCHPNECNGYNGLACVKGRCDCFDSYLLYDTSTKSCVAVSSSSDE